MRIAFLLSSLHLSGGVRAVIEYANRLAARGHRCVLVIPGGARDAHMAREVASNVEIVESDVGLPARRGYSMDYARLTWSLARKTPRSDVVFSTHTPTTVANLVAGRILRKGKLVWLYMDYPGMFADRPVEAWLLRHALRWHDLAVTISENETRTLRSFGPGQVETVRMGLSHLDLWRPTPIEQRAVDDVQTLLYVGDSRPRKGLQDFLAAAALVYAERQDIHLRIVCKDTCAVETPVPHTMIYHPEDAELADLYATSDLFVSTSWWEGLGLPPLEAMASATPVVMTNTGGGLEYARNEENCLLVPIKQPDAVAAAILRVLDDRTLAQRLSHNGPSTAAQFDWEVVTDRLERYLCELVEGT